MPPNTPPYEWQCVTERAAFAGRDGDGVEPRISMSFSFADPEFEPPYITAAGALPFPALELRVALVSAQLINYSSLGGTAGAGWKAVAGPLAGGGGAASWAMSRATAPPSARLQRAASSGRWG